MLEIREIEDWIKKNINTETIDTLSVQISELAESINKKQIAPVLYELGSKTSLGAFLLWLNLARKENSHAFAPIFPEAFTAGQGKRLEYVAAFRELNWIETEETRPLENEKHYLYRAAIIAGLKKQAFLKTRSFAENRIQGGKIISDWSLIKQIMSELYLEVHRDEKLIGTLELPTALSIMSNSDLFVSKCMQVFGGAGYIEDYEIESLFRACHFLKNWPVPYREALQLINPFKGKI